MREKREKPPLSEAEFRRKIISATEWLCVVMTMSAMAQCAQSTAGVNSKLDRIANAIENHAATLEPNP